MNAPSPSPNPLHFTRFRDIDPRPMKEFLVQKLLGAGEISCFFAKPGAGKSVLVSDMGCHIASGRPWFGRSVLRGAVLYVAAERAKLVERRMAAFRLHYGEADLPLAIVSGAIDLRSSPEHASLIAAYAKNLAEDTALPLRLIVIDTVSRVLAGGDENSSKDMGAFVSALSSLQETTGAHICIIHHIPQDGSNRMRGHGALLGAVDTTISIERTGKARVATVIKDNDGAEGQKIAFKLESVLLSTDPSTGTETWAPIAVPTDEEAAMANGEPNTLSRPQVIALRALHSAIADKGELAPECGHVPTGKRVVSLKLWADYAYGSGVSGSCEPRARQKAFKQAREALAVRGKVAVWEPYVWPLANS
ncbi:hypothetical protein CWB41_04890 [Methylovirgula ligni]|uniref:AAA domain-containing protein n=1 Tax=Methylovirgula ligni TaxID=569860 RepID=A0A3D9ZDM7_9HYPH|nr:AAA family ATPase [Methylovirgula ligni]QAY95149.1 hypothetical protein CWB41_04890 [Methylovirgula ligni]REF89566.1 AAA domain-containing protein [Methylovirgula ligni]